MSNAFVYVRWTDTRDGGKNEKFFCRSCARRQGRYLAASRQHMSRTGLVAATLNVAAEWRDAGTLAADGSWIDPGALKIARDAITEARNLREGDRDDTPTR